MRGKNFGFSDEEFTFCSKRSRRFVKKLALSSLIKGFGSLAVLYFQEPTDSLPV